MARASSIGENAALSGGLAASATYFGLNSADPGTTGTSEISGGADGYSHAYVSRMRSLLIDICNEALRQELASRNVAELAHLPRCEERPKRRSLTSEETRAVLEAARDHRLGALVVVGLHTGLRPGELTGLLWSDLKLDAEQPTLTVSGSMLRQGSTLVRGAVKKSTAGYRTIRLPEATVEALRRHRTAQEAERRRMGRAWASEDLVFCSEAGTPLDPSNVRKVFTRIVRSAGVDPTGITLYLMRHTVASLLIEAGATIEEVADLFGDNPATLWRHYRHRVAPSVGAAERMADIVR